MSTDYPVTKEVLDVYDLIQFYFFTNSSGYDYFVDVQIYLRMSIKMEYGYTDSITPIELSLLFAKAEKLEESKKKDLENR